MILTGRYIYYIDLLIHFKLCIMGECYILNPDYLLKNDVSRVVLYSKSTINNGGSRGWLSFLYPFQAMVLSYFTHSRSYCENIKLIAKHIGKDEETTRNLLIPFIENEQSLTSYWNGEKIRYPKKILVNSCDVLNYESKLQKITIDEMECEGPINVSSRRVNKMPLMYTFMLTNRCMTHCKYCYADTHTHIKKELSTNRILELIHESSELGIQNIDLIGGEIFLHKDWCIILDNLMKYGYEPELISTKYPMTLDMIKKLVSLNYTNSIQISLDSIEVDILEKMLSVGPNYIRKIFETISLLEESGLNYYVSTVLTKYNASSQAIFKIYEYLKSLRHLQKWDIRFAMDSLYQEAMKQIKLSRDETLEVSDFIKSKIIGQSPLIIHLDDSLLTKEFYLEEKGGKAFKGAKCSALNSHMFVLPDGKVTICEQLYWNRNFIIGDLNESSISEVWNSPRVKYLLNLRQEQIQDQSSCKTCAQFESCYDSKNRCWTDIMKAYGVDNWDYPDPRCNRAPVMKNNLQYT